MLETSGYHYIDDIIEDIAFYKDVANDYESDYFKQELDELENQAKNLLTKELEYFNGNFTVDTAVIGNFSCGKSTFINSIIGKPVCPMKVNPTTSSLTKFLYGDHEEILILDENQSKKSISYNDFQKIVQHETGQTSTTKSVEIHYHYPYDIFKSISLYDTPGFKNSLNNNDQVITEKISKVADSIFLVIDINGGGVIDVELNDVLQEIREKNDNLYWFYILNRCDEKPPKTIAKVVDKAKSKYGNLFQDYYAYSAKEVLDNLDEVSEIENFKEFNIDTVLEKHIENLNNLQNEDKNQKGFFKKITKGGNGDVSKESLYNFIEELKEDLQKIHLHKKTNQNNEIPTFYNERINIINNIKDIGFKAGEIEINNITSKRKQYNQDKTNKINELKKGLQNMANEEQNNSYIDILDTIQDQTFEKLIDKVETLRNMLNSGIKNSFSVRELSKKEKSHLLIPYAIVFFDKKKHKININEITDFFQYFLGDLVKYTNDNLPEELVNELPFKEINSAIEEAKEDLAASINEQIEEINSAFPNGVSSDESNVHEDLDDAKNAFEYILNNTKEFSAERITNKTIAHYNNLFIKYENFIHNLIGFNAGAKYNLEKTAEKIDNFLEKNSK